MNWELDHVLFATSDAGPVERALAEFGFTFTEHRVHRGQGTANARAIFENASLEIMRSDDLEELRSDVVKPLGLDERIHWRDTGACPFGLCFRPGAAAGDPRAWPFETWDYEAAYLPKGTSIPIVTPARCVLDPLVFITARSESPGGMPTRLRETGLHRGERRTLTRVGVHRPEPTSPLSAGVRWFVENGLFSLDEGDQHVLELEWDRGQEGRSHRFAAGVPIVVRW
jgi:hypothetical protein